MATISLDEYIVEVGMDAIKSYIMLESKLRRRIILNYLRSKNITDVSVADIFKPETSSEATFCKELNSYIATSLRISPTPRVILTVSNSPDEETDETHFIGILADKGKNPIQLYKFDTGIVVFEPKLLNSCLAKLPAQYKLVREDEGAGDCQISTQNDTFCQTWSAYYSTFRAMDPAFGMALKEVSLSSSNLDRTAELYRLFGTFVLPGVGSDAELKKIVFDGFNTSVQEDMNSVGNLPKYVDKLPKSSDELHARLSVYFNKKIDKSRFHRLINLNSDDERIITVGGGARRKTRRRRTSSKL